MSTVKTAVYAVPKPANTIRLVHSKDVEVKIANIRSLIKVKTSGDLKGRAFYLPKAFRWIMANDSKGNLCLLPRKRS